MSESVICLCFNCNKPVKEVFLAAGGWYAATCGHCGLRGPLGHDPLSAETQFRTLASAFVAKPPAEPSVDERISMDEKDFMAAYAVTKFMAKLDCKTGRWLVRCINASLDERERAEAAKGGDS